jgi:hypothetical protein
VDVYQTLVDGRGVSATGEAHLDGFAMDRGRAADRLRPGEAPNSAPKSVVTPFAGFEGGRDPTRPAAGQDPGLFQVITGGFPANMRRSDHLSRPSARICCFLSSLKTLLTSTEGIPSRPD